MRRPLLLDRDGVLNADVKPYVTDPNQFQLFPWTVRALVTLDRAGFDLYVVSNQQGVALGLTPPEVLDACSEIVQSSLRPYGFGIRKFYYCTAHRDENHPWRKPSPGMILAAAEAFGFDPADSILIGDKPGDVEAAHRAGAKGWLVLSGVTSADESWQSWPNPPDWVFPTLAEAAEALASTRLL